MEKVKQFEVGKEYEFDCGNVIRVLRRTQKCIVVTNGGATWRMVIRKDDCGKEYVVDSSVPERARELFTCRAEWESK